MAQAKILFLGDKPPKWIFSLNFDVYYERFFSENLLLNGQWGYNRCDSIFRDLFLIVKHTSPDLVIGEGLSGLIWGTSIKLLFPHIPQCIIPRAAPFQPLYALSTLLFSSVALSSDCIISGSRSASRLFSKFNIRSEDFHVPGIAPLFSARIERRQNENIDRILPNSPYIIYAGRIFPDRDIIGLLDVFHQLKLSVGTEIHLVISTHIWESEYLEKVQNLSRKIGNVKFYFNPEKSLLRILYEKSLGFLSIGVSTFETFGRAPLEALYTGVPVVVPNFVGALQDLFCEQCKTVPVKPFNGILIIDKEKFLNESISIITSPPTKLSLTEREQLLLPYSRKYSLERFSIIISEAIRSSQEEVVSDNLLLDKYASQLKELWDHLHLRSKKEILCSIITKNYYDVFGGVNPSNVKKFYRFLYDEYFPDTK